MVAAAVDTETTLAALALLRQRHDYLKWPGVESPDGISKQLAEALDHFEGTLIDVVTRLATDGTLVVGGLTATTMAVGSTQRVVNAVSVTADSQDEGSPWEDTTKLITLAVPTDEVLIGVGLTVDEAWVSGDAATDSVSVILGITGGDTDRAAESVELIGASTGLLVWPAGVGLGEGTGAGTWQLLFTAGGSEPTLAHLSSGIVTATALTVPL